MTNRLDLKTPDGVSQNIERIAALFPHCVTETMDGKQIDFDLLRQELSRDIVEGPKERYRLEWPGKREAIVTANMPTTNTLRPVREESVNFDTTENLYIEGDNLEVLKLLQESYLGKVKMIYIDPPYNTGNDFVYRDNFAQDSDEYKADSGMTDELGNRLVANPETAGRYHSDWLTMMYPRLKLARNLLTDDGVIFISIDDNEVHNLRKMCDEVFGVANFIACFIWEKRTNRENRKAISVRHDYVVCYCLDAERKENLINLLPMTEEALARYKNPDNDTRGLWKSDPAHAQAGHGTKSQFYVLKAPNGKEHSLPGGRCWLYTEDVMNEAIKDGRIWFGEDGNNVPRIKTYLNAKERGLTPESILFASDASTNEKAKNDIKLMFDGFSVFETPKPIELIKVILKLSGKEGLVLDFFSGSAATAHAVMQLNAEDASTGSAPGRRKFIMVQLPEKTDEKSEAYKAGYKNICEIGKERIRRAGAKLAPAPQPPKGGVESASLSLFGTDEANSELKTQNPKLDIGFRVYRLDTSNMQDVYYRPQDYKQDMMTELFANHIKPDRTPDDLVAQVMLDWGLPLSLPITQTIVAGKTVYKVDGNALYCCFDEHISEDFARAVAPEKPLRIVFHDYAFANDTAKENVRQLLKQLSAETEMRVI